MTPLFFACAVAVLDVVLDVLAKGRRVLAITNLRARGAGPGIPTPSKNPSAFAHLRAPLKSSHRFKLRTRAGRLRGALRCCLLRGSRGRSALRFPSSSFPPSRVRRVRPAFAWLWSELVVAVDSLRQRALPPPFRVSSLPSLFKLLCTSLQCPGGYGCIGSARAD